MSSGPCGGPEVVAGGVIRPSHCHSSIPLPNLLRREGLQVALGWVGSPQGGVMLSLTGIMG